MVCHAGWGLALDQDTCIHIPGECGFLPTGPIGVANLSEIPVGPTAKEPERFLRENSVEIRGFRPCKDDQQKSNLAVGTSTMKTITRRLRKLEESFAPPVSEEDSRLTEILPE
jgi:hypothetical protein